MATRAHERDVIADARGAGPLRDTRQAIQAALVDGREDNLMVTPPADLALARYLISNR